MEPFLFDTCREVNDSKQEEVVLGTSETSERRRLTVAKASAAGAAVVAHGEPTGVVAAALDLPWTERGGVVVDDLAPFEVKNLGAVFGLWFLFCSFAIAKALSNSNSDRVQATRKSAVGDSDAPEGADMVENAMKDVLPIIEAAVRKAMSTTILEVQATASSKVVDTKLTATSSQVNVSDTLALNVGARAWRSNVPVHQRNRPAPRLHVRAPCDPGPAVVD
eukprot:scaffold72530_cov64-Phaeocystis_antarctica.AAC.5